MLSTTRWRMTLRSISAKAASFGRSGFGSGGLVLEDALAACGKEGVEDLASLDGGYAGVADGIHGVPSLDRHEKVSETDDTAD